MLVWEPVWSVGLSTQFLAMGTIPASLTLLCMSRICYLHPFHNSVYLSLVFQSCIGCFSEVLLVLDPMSFAAFLCSICAPGSAAAAIAWTTAFAPSVTAHVIAWVIIYISAIFDFLLLSFVCFKNTCLHIFLAFYFWQHELLLALYEVHNTGSFYCICIICLSVSDYVLEILH